MFRFQVFIQSAVISMAFGCTQVPTDSTVNVATPQVSPTFTPTIAEENFTPTIAQQNFKKVWTSKYESIKREILGARSKWNEKNIRSYSFVAAKDRAGNSSPWNRSPVLIKVEEGRTTSIELVDKDRRLAFSRTDGFEEFDTIDKLFDYMLSELERGQIVSGDYDKNFSFPKAAHITESFDHHGGRSILISRFSHAK